MMNNIIFEKITFSLKVSKNVTGATFPLSVQLKFVLGFISDDT